MMRYVFYVFVLTIATFLALSLEVTRSIVIIPETSEQPGCWINPIQKKIIRKYTKKYKMYVKFLILYKEVFSKDNLWRIGVYFDIDYLISKEKARQIIVECVQDYMREINTCEELCSYFRDYPISTKNIDIGLQIREPNQKKPSYPNLCCVRTCDNEILYKTVNPKQPDLCYIEEKEGFEDAVKLIKTAISVNYLDYKH